MHKNLALAAAVLLLALPLTGCIENMGDLKERLQRQAATDNTTGDELAAAALNETANLTRELRPPVARITIFGPGGALVYRANFAAENQTEPVMANGGEFNLVAADSEAVQGGSTLERFEWIVDGVAHEGRAATVTIEEAGLYMISLRVTDSLGSVDEQMVHLGIAPQPFTEETVLAGGLVVGVDPMPTAAESQTFTVKADQDGKPLKVQAIKVVLDAGAVADSILTVTDPNGESTTRDSAGNGGAETLEFGGGAPGVWTVTVTMFSAGTTEWSAAVSVTYVEIVEGLGDGHAHGH